MRTRRTFPIGDVIDADAVGELEMDLEAHDVAYDIDLDRKVVHVRSLPDDPRHRQHLAGKKPENLANPRNRASVAAMKDIFGV